MNARDRVPDKTLPEWVEFYWRIGLQPLPSSRRDKRPLIPYGHAWESDLAVDWKRFPDCNLQIMTGRHWGLLVVDLDGPQARGWLDGFPRTWTVQSGSGNGYHLWYQVGPTVQPLPKCFLHRGEGNHAAIERLCDRSLIVVPPSVHPKTGKPYLWVRNRNPFVGRIKDRPMEFAPSWVINHVANPAPTPNQSGDFGKAPVNLHRRLKGCGRLLDQIADKVALARSWGLRIAASQPNAAGWLACHALGREDRTPSASFRVASGHYSEPGAGLSLNLYELGAALGAYSDAQACVDDLAFRFGDRRVQQPSRSGGGRQ
jgi:hypothetical protein